MVGPLRSASGPEPDTLPHTLTLSPLSSPHSSHSANDRLCQKSTNLARANVIAHMCYSMSVSVLLLLVVAVGGRFVLLLGCKRVQTPRFIVVNLATSAILQHVT